MIFVVLIFLMSCLLFFFPFLLSAFFPSSVSFAISSIGFGGGVVAMVHPIQTPIPNIAITARNTGTAMSQNSSGQLLTALPK
jgi:hypothetical protein